MRRWHDFASGREARRSAYREYSQAVRQSPEAKLAPALRVVSKIGAGFVELVVHFCDTRLLALRASTDFGHNDARVSLCYALLSTRMAVAPTIPYFMAFCDLESRDT